MPSFCGIQWKYPVQLQVDSWQGWRCSAFKNTHSVRQQMWDNYFSSVALKLVPKNVTSRPSDTHRWQILCQLECRELKKGGGMGVGGAVSETENKLSPSTDYYQGRCLAVWTCVLSEHVWACTFIFLSDLTSGEVGLISRVSFYVALKHWYQFESLMYTRKSKFIHAYSSFWQRQWSKNGKREKTKGPT